MTRHFISQTDPSGRTAYSVRAPHQSDVMRKAFSSAFRCETECPKDLARLIAALDRLPPVSR
jgi:hypothetical protein